MKMGKDQAKDFIEELHTLMCDVSELRLQQAQDTSMRSLFEKEIEEIEKRKQRLIDILTGDYYNV